MVAREIDWAKPGRRRPPAPQPAASLVGRQSCAVCQLRTNTLICNECAEQSEASRARVLAWLSANVARANALLAEWDAVRENHQGAWETIQDARDLPDYAARCAKHQAAGNIYGRLLDAHARYEHALQPLGIERARLEKALALLEAL